MSTSDDAVSLKKSSEKELCQWAESVGLSRDQLASQIVSMALRQMTRAADQAVRPSNVVPIKK